MNDYFYLLDQLLEEHMDNRGAGSDELIVKLIHFVDKMQERGFSEGTPEYKSLKDLKRITDIYRTKI